MGITQVSESTPNKFNMTLHIRAVNDWERLELTLATGHEPVRVMVYY